uniref:non-specific serine/threonine protein kinase n=1 Tax=Cajanus cajan TaxID=3821 RepID=A0A151RHN8_CAJCA|nr:Lectin-domain containing receptor kinase A4.2 [Cajanus cajan]
MRAVDPTRFGDGLSFFIAPFDSVIPNNSAGGYLGLFSNESALDTSKNQLVAVEFDSFMNDWDPSSDHVGINVNSIKSVANVTWRSSIKNGSVANTWIWYNSTTKNLSVFLTYANNPTFSGNSSLWYVIDLREVLPEFVRVGFSAATGQWIEIHNILSWSFSSNLDVMLSWGVRYKVALGLASALLYLHEEWEQCVVHRDIKASNVMLDANFNAKLGDFGLARLVDHELGSQTTVLAGTMGYLAPECVTTGKSSKESDVYSFGVVALEITCGRRPVEVKEEPGKVRLVEWVWSLYGRGKLLEASDEKLNWEFDEQQMECLMVVGLWCCHPDHTTRPSIRQVISVLNFEAPLPSLPSQLPVARYFAPPMDMCKFSYTSSAATSSTTKGSSSYSSSISAGSRKSLL